MEQILDMLHAINKLHGAVSIVEMAGVYNAVVSHLKSEEGMAIDFGSHEGRSSIAGVKALTDMRRWECFYMVDLLYDLNNPDWSSTTQKTSENLPWQYAQQPNFADNTVDNVRQFGYFGGEEFIRVEKMGLSSKQFLSLFPNRKISYVFIDSDDHQLELVMYEVKELEDRMLKGGLMFFHDFGNQYTAPKEAHKYLLDTGKYENINMDWEMIKNFINSKGLKDSDLNWQTEDQKAMPPTFVGCVRKK